MSPTTFVARHNLALRGWFRSDIIVIHYRLFGCLVSCSDVLISVIAALLSHQIYRSWIVGAYGFHSLISAAGVGLVGGMLYYVLAQSAGLYSLSALLRADRFALRAALYALLATFLLASMLFLIRAGAEISRGTFLFFLPLQQAFLLVGRLATVRITNRLMESGMLVGPTAVILGDGAELSDLSEEFLMSEFGLKEVGRVAIDGPTHAMRGDGVDSALALSRTRGAEKLVVAVKWQDAERLAFVQDGLRRSALPALLLPDSTVRRVSGSCIGYPGHSALRALELQRAPMKSVTLTSKRVLDITFAAFALIILSPLMIGAAIAIRLESSGPIIFRQRRHGFDRRPFTIFKFRSMTVREDGNDVVQASKGDARVTRVGAILRQTSIDELPQLFNVLLGHMSLVGPRPHALAHDDTYATLIDRYSFRHRVKPGITGWAQINGARGQTQLVQQMKNRVDLDLWYIDHCSLWLDLLILARTCFEVLRRDAY